MPDTTIFGGGSDQSDAYAQAAQVQAGSAAAAAQSQLTAARESNALIKEMYQTGRADLAPWRSTGQTALDVYNRMLGLPSVYSYQQPTVPGQVYPQPTAAPTTPTGAGAGTYTPTGVDSIDFLNQTYYGIIPPNTDYNVWLTTGKGVKAPTTAGAGAGSPQLSQNALLANYNQATSAPSGLDPTAWIKQTPGYEFQYGEGLNALDRSAASKGMLLSGQQTRAAQEYGQNFALNHYDSYMNRLASLAGIGQTTAGQSAQAGQSMATQSAQNTMTGAGNAAQANMAGANAIGSGYVNAANASQANQNSMMNNIGSLGGLGLAGLSAWGGGAGSAAGLGGALSTMGGWIGLSDKRLKQNIHVANDIDSMAVIEKMQPTYFDYLPGIGGSDQLGFIADDIEKIIPSAVMMRDGFRVINPVPIMAVLVKAIQDQQKQIDDLKGATHV